MAHIDYSALDFLSFTYDDAEEVCYLHYTVHTVGSTIRCQ